MAKQKEKKVKQTTSQIPDKDQYTAGGPRQKPGPMPRSPQADNRPERETHPLPEKAGEGGPNEGKWKAEDVPPFARTYKEPLDEEGNEE